MNLDVATQTSVARDSPRRPRTAIPRRTWVVAVAAGVIFLALQTVLAFYASYAAREAAAQGARVALDPLGHRLVIALAGGLFGFMGFGLLGSILASRRGTLIFLLPASLYVLLDIVFSPAHVPRAIGNAWNLPCYAACPGPWFSNPWVGSFVDLLLVGTPIAVAGLANPMPRRRLQLDSVTTLSFATAAGVVALVYRTLGVTDVPPETPSVAAVIAYSIVAGVTRPPWLMGQALVSLAASGSAAALLVAALVAPVPDFRLDEAGPYLMNSVLPLLALGVAAAIWEPIQLLATWAKTAPRRLAVLLNLLNVADALMTHFAVRSGDALELNPIVRYVGLPLKIVVVAGVSILIYRLKPHAIIWPTLALLLVLAYHLSGLFISP